MILVVGATGALGSAICRLLRKEGRPTRVLVRSGAPREQELRSLGCEIAIGDLKDPASLAAACRGVTAIVSTATAVVSRRSGDSLDSVDRGGQLALVEAARKEGVKRFVFVSVSPNLAEDSPLIRAKREVERALRASGMEWTILQPSDFMEVWLGAPLGWNLEKGNATVFGSGTEPVSWISLEDVAKYAVVSLSDRRTVNKDIPLGGPEALPPLQVVQICQEVLGRRFKVKKIPRAIPRVMSVLLRPLNPIQASLMALGAATAGGDVVGSPLQKELSVSLTSVRDYAQSATARTS